MTNVVIPPNALTLRRWPTGLLLVGVALFFIATRLLDEGSTRSAVLAVAGALYLAAVGGRVLARVRATSSEAKSYLTTVGVADALTLVGAVLVLVADKKSVLLGVGVGVVVLGAGLLLAVELVATEMRATGFIDMRRVLAAARTASILVFALVALSALNYAVDRLEWRADFSFAAPTSPSAATLSLLESVSCAAKDASAANDGATGAAATAVVGAAKPEVFLFFERGSTALGEIRAYFEGLERAGAKVVTQDSAVDPGLAKDLKVQKNGSVAFRCGARTEYWSVGDDRDDAQRKLKKLDEEVRTRLAKITKDPVNVYVTIGHGERSLEDSAKPGERAAAKGLKKLIESTNAKVKKLGIADGLSKKVPDDAALVVVASPTIAPLPEEVSALTTYVQGGGALLLMLDPVVGTVEGGDVVGALEPLFAALGVKAGTQEVLNDAEYVEKSRTSADWAFIFSTSFGSHKSIKTLSGARGKAAVLFLSAVAIDKRNKDAPEPKVSLIARTRPNSFVDANGNRAYDKDSEARALLDFAAAVEVKADGGKEGRAWIVGDSDAFADGILANQANTIFAYEGLLWLLRDDDKAAGGVEVDEDVEIRHTRDEDKVWFYGTVFLAPALILGLGLVYTMRRKQRRGAA